MTVKLMDRSEELAFEKMARSLLDSGMRPTLVRVRLGQKFGLSAKQIQNALGRVNICLSDYKTKARRLRDLSQEQQAEMVQMARVLSEQGVSNDEIRSTVAEKYNIYERSVATRCLKEGLDIRSIFSVINEQKHKISVEGPDLGNCDFSLEGNIFAKAARKVEGASYIPGEGCYIGRTPVSGAYLMREANMEFPQ